MKHAGFVLNLIALGLFFPGIFLPMFTLNTEMKVILSNSSFTSSLVDEELSIMQTVETLWDDQRWLVAALIFVFSVTIPLLKGLMVVLAYIRKNTNIEARLLSFVAHIGKWSMADVFVVAIFLAVLSTDHAGTTETHHFTLFGLSLAVDISSQTLSSLGQGFYYFVGYCMLSLFGTHLAFASLGRTS